MSSIPFDLFIFIVFLNRYVFGFYLALVGRKRLDETIEGDELTVWIDDRPSWRGTLPDNARALSGPAGLRSDNLAFDLVALSAVQISATADRGAERPCHDDDEI